MKLALIASLMCALLCLTGCGVRSASTSAREVDAAFDDVLDLYGERLELAVQASALARHYLPPDAPALVEVDNTSAVVARITASRALLESPASFDRFDVAQRDLSDAISHLLITCEAVRDLAGSRDFRLIQSRLAACAASIAAARERYSEAARSYNAARHEASLNLADRLRDGQDKPVFTVPDKAPSSRHPRTDVGTSRGAWPVQLRRGNRRDSRSVRVLRRHVEREP